MDYEPLKQWKCDNCGEKIEEPSQGNVEWQYEENKQKSYYNFKIIHKKCSHSGITRRMWWELKSFTECDALGDLYFLFLDDGPFFEPNYKGPYVKSMREFTEIMKRLTIPHYEEARLYFNNAVEDGYLDGGENQSAFYSQDSLKKIIKRYSQ